MKSFREYLQENKFLVVAHRGASGNYPENTIVAYNEALKHGIQILEIDVRLTRDNEIVAFHDEILNRIANINSPIEELSTKEIANIDVGKWFGNNFTEKIPTLREVIDIIKDKAYLIIELKSNNNNREFFSKKLFEIINERNFNDFILLASFDTGLIKLIKQNHPSSLACIIRDPNSNKLPHKLIDETNADGVICSIDELNDELISDIKINKIPVGVYDVDTVEQLTKCLQANVLGIGTNYPQRILSDLKNGKI